MKNTTDDKSLNILLFSFDWRNLYETNIEEIFEKFERDGIMPAHNRIFSINWSTKGYYKRIRENIETVHLKAYVGHMRFPYDLANIFLAPFLLKKYHFIPDVVVVYDFPSVFIGLGAKFFWGSKIAVMVTNIPTQLVRTRRLWRVLYLHQVISEFFAKYFIDYAIAISAATEKYLKDLGISTRKIRVFSPNVIGRDKKYIEAMRVGVVRKKFNIPKDKKIILSVGRLEPEKNFETLIRVFSDLKNDNLVLIIAGQGMLREKLEGLAHKLCLNNRVIFAGRIERKDIWNFYRDADIFILLSDSEGLGLVFWEAMYARVPVIGSMASGIVETVGKDGLRGFLISDEENLDSINAKISACIGRDKNVDLMMERAHQYVLNKISHVTTINAILGS